MNTFCSATFVSLLLLFPSLAAQAQSNFVDVSSNAAEPAIITPPSTHPYGEFSIYTSGTLANPQIMSDLKGQRLFFAGVRMTSRLFTTPHLFIGGNLDVKPLVIHSKTVPSGRQYTYGGGFSVGLQFAPRVAWHWQPFFDVDGGFVCFPHDVPLPNTRRLNMTLDFGPGVMVPLRGNNAMRTGVWLFHFSDGNTAPRNPAFDGIMVCLLYLPQLRAALPSQAAFLVQLRFVSGKFRASQDWNHLPDPSDRRAPDHSLGEESCQRDRDKAID